jgi:hypothetical protein
MSNVVRFSDYAPKYLVREAPDKPAKILEHPIMQRVPFCTLTFAEWVRLNGAKN